MSNYDVNQLKRLQKHLQNFSGSEKYNRPLCSDCFLDRFQHSSSLYHRMHWLSGQQVLKFLQFAYPQGFSMLLPPRHRNRARNQVFAKERSAKRFAIYDNDINRSSYEKYLSPARISTEIDLRIKASKE